MSRDFILIFSGGMVSLITTLVIIFVMDYFYRREQLKSARPESGPPAESSMTRATPPETKTEPSQPPESKKVLAQEEMPTSQ